MTDRFAYSNEVIEKYPALFEIVKKFTNTDLHREALKALNEITALRRGLQKLAEEAFEAGDVHGSEVSANLYKGSHILTTDFETWWATREKKDWEKS